MTDLAWNNGTAQWAQRRKILAPVIPSGARSAQSRTSKRKVNSGPAQDCAASPTEHLFTNKERDAETGNDYFGARYYSSMAGRFLTPDWSAKVEPVPYSKLDDPQTLNLYAYVGNNPFVREDADGHQEGCKSSSASRTCNAGAKVKESGSARRHHWSARTVVKGGGEIIGGVVVTGAAVLAAPEVATAISVGGVVLGVLGGEGAAAKGIVDVAKGSDAIDEKHAEDTKKGVDLATNPVTAAALPFTSQQNAIRIGDAVAGAYAARDIGELTPTSKHDAINKISAAKELVTDAYNTLKSWISPTPVY